MLILYFSIDKKDEIFMKEKIKQQLKSVEKENEIVILLAVESGSRAWGFASQDSDYDVRFVYIEKPQRYLSIDEGKDVIEYPVNDLLDISGWDIRKTLKLFRKSNPPLLEWLHSPIIYCEKFEFAEKLREFSLTYFSPKSCLHHYLNMAKGNYRDYLQRDIVRIKKYFYVLRPVFACCWIQKHDTIPPVEFNKLLHNELINCELKNEIEKLLLRKINGDELDKGAKIEIINEYLENKIDDLTDLVSKYDKPAGADTEKLNALFRSTLKVVWD